MHSYCTGVETQHPDFKSQPSRSRSRSRGGCRSMWSESACVGSLQPAAADARSWIPDLVCVCVCVCFSSWILSEEEKLKHSTIVVLYWTWFEENGAANGNGNGNGIGIGTLRVYFVLPATLRGCVVVRRLFRALK